jgi:demethylmenaquinone methyltransferase/2-methoxy-6-polyprenyl-1,4-benzoquinol methylase
MSPHDSAGPAAGATVARFDQLARAGRALRLDPADAPKLEQLRQRLGDLRGLRVLEPGCGTGPLTVHLARWVAPGGSVDAFDPSAASLDLCREAVAGCGAMRVTQCRCEDAEWPAASFDRVICFRVWPHFADAPAVAARFHRWLQPGGRLHIVHWQGRAALAAVHGTEPALAHHVLPPGDALAALLRAHGFAVCTAIDTADEFYLDAVKG